VSDQENRFRWMLGAFYTDSDDTSDSDWHVLGLAGIPGSFVEGPDIYWTTNYNRTYEETAFFGEVSFDFTDKLSASASVRTFDYDANLAGFSGTVWWPCGGFAPGHPDNNYGEDCADVDRTTSGNDEVYRASLEYQFNDDVMLYTSWGEGYRPGGLNRFCATRLGTGLGSQGAILASCAFTSDFLTSYEVGIKSTLMNGRLRINAAAFWQDWDDFQFSRLDTSISPLTLTFNVGTAESNGFEGDFQILLTDNWELGGAASFLSSELTQDYRRNPANPTPDAAAGTPLPRVPETKWNLTSRYNFDDSGWFLQGAYVYTGDSFNTLFDGGSLQTRRVKQPSYQILNASVGMQSESWAAQLYVRNLTDERGAVFINAVNWDSREMTNRPRTVGVSYTMRF
jgi:outer membrane receptor protein involved in Fe transport